jgi:hypothetical protein
VGLEDRDSAGGTFSLLLSLLWRRTPAVAASFSMVRVVCLVANCTFRYTTGALAIAIRVGHHTPLVSASDAGLLLILVCFNRGVSQKEPPESRQLTKPGVLTTLRLLFAKIRVSERYSDVSTVMEEAMARGRFLAYDSAAWCT